eukprot:gene28912-34890_t
MGNDLDVCSKDGYIQQYYEQETGPAKETPWQFFNRSSERFLNRIIAPQKFAYETHDLHPSRYCSPVYSLPSDVTWDPTEFNIFSQGLTLHCCYWKRTPFAPNNTNQDDAAQMKSPALRPLDSTAPVLAPAVCILYLHTNLRSLCDALEVLPVAAEVGASIVAMDLPGCGQSAGTLSGTMEADIALLVDWIKCLEGSDVRIIIWARGLATAPAIDYCASFCNSTNARTGTEISVQGISEKGKENGGGWGWFKSSNSSNANSKKEQTGGESKGETASEQDRSVKCLILDSPFTGVKEMIRTGLERMHGVGFTFTKTIMSWGIKRILAAISDRLQFDVASVRPLSVVPHLHSLRGAVLVPDDDDYLTVDMGLQISGSWPSNPPVPVVKFPGKHFTPRSAQVVLSVLATVQESLGLLGESGTSQGKNASVEGLGGVEFLTPSPARGEALRSRAETVSSSGMEDLDLVPAEIEAAEEILQFVDIDNSDGQGAEGLRPATPPITLTADALASLSNASAGMTMSKTRSLSSLALQGLG